MNREEAIAHLRDRLTAMTDEDNCACKVASEQGVFCHGFRRWTEKELRDRYWWIVRKRPEITRDELEAIANQWQLVQQDVRDAGLACDVQAKIHDTCRGWDDFSTEELIAAAQRLPARS